MVTVVYLVILPCVIALLLAALLFPFWKVWRRLQTHHPDIWNAAGPFRVADMLASPGLAGLFILVLSKMNRDPDLRARDPDIVRWVAACIEVLRFLPKGLWAQVMAGLVALYLLHRVAAGLAQALAG